MSSEGTGEPDPLSPQPEHIPPVAGSEEQPSDSPLLGANPPAGAYPPYEAPPSAGTPAGPYPQYSGYPPAGAYPPAGIVPGMYPPPGYPPPGYVPPGYPPPGFAPTYPLAPYVPAPTGAGGSDASRTPRGRRPGLGAWPQGIGDMIGTIFRLYGQNFLKLSLLSLLVAGLPALLAGAPVVLALYLLGFDVTQSYLQNVLPGGGFWNSIGGNTLSSYDPNNPQSYVPPVPQLPVLSVTPEQWLLLGSGLGVGLLLIVLLTAWQMGALAIAARDCTLGRPLSIRAALSGGLRRLLPVLGTVVLVGLVLVGLYMLAAVAVVAISAIAASALFNGPLQGGRANTGIFFVVLMLVVAVYCAFYVAYFYVLVRLGMAPYIASADGLSPGRAFGRSWSLVGGNWWRTFTPLLIIGFALGFAASLLLTPGEFAPLFVFFMILAPLVSALSAPLWVVAFVAMYYDLRLRREGYLPLATELDLPINVPPPLAWPFGTPPPSPTGPAQPGQPRAG